MTNRKESEKTWYEAAGAEGEAYRRVVKRGLVALMMMDNGSGGGLMSLHLICRAMAEEKSSPAPRIFRIRAALSAKAGGRRVVAVRPFAVKARPEAGMPHMAGDRAYKVLAMTKDQLLVADDRNRIVWVDRIDVLYANGESA